ncbi:MAG: DUF3604 domain-containing protein, partial [Myxococcota bacterium]|nr:DUF3604 domain-containing protein [Myxococcota bacterium]
MDKPSRILALLFFVLLALGCDSSSNLNDRGQTGDAQLPSVFEIQDEVLAREPVPGPDPERRAFFGDLHVHTTHSFDAYAMGTLATPHDAYRFAKGEAIEHAAGFDLQLEEPLDFYAVTDHAMFLGVAAEAADTTTVFSKNAFAEPLHDLNAPDNRGLLGLPGRMSTFATFIPNLIGAIQEGQVDNEAVLDISRGAWADIIRAADLHNDPGRFTTFVAYEYTTWSGDMGNLHRNVVFRGSDELPAVPFSRVHSANPEDLWAWMDELREQGIESLAIPHNSNGSNGQMFKLVDWAENPMDDDYSERRIRNEPLIEITQIKGTSETHPLLSSEDEWAGFELMETRVATNLPSEAGGSYARDALLRGLSLEDQGVVNPYSFGFIGSSDTHTAASEVNESKFVSKLGLMSATPNLRGSVPFSPLLGTVLSFVPGDLTTEVDGGRYMGGAPPTFGASGLAAVWAEENTRESIYDAFRRKETFATSGPRMQLRFFAGYDLKPVMLDQDDVITAAYAKGVSMGGDLRADDGREPAFLLWALSDPRSGPLQRAQIVKGWIDSDGQTHERVYDVACSGGSAVDPETQRCPDNGARVDLETCAASGEGSAQLRTVWSDPDF